MNHTAGKWFVELTEDKGKEYKISTDCPRNPWGHPLNGDAWVCSVWTPKTGETYAHGHRNRELRDYKEAEANANLIAVAPELYDVCKQLLSENAIDKNHCLHNVIIGLIGRAEGKK